LEHPLKFRTEFFVKRTATAGGAAAVARDYLEAGYPASSSTAIKASRGCEDSTVTVRRTGSASTFAWPSTDWIAFVTLLAQPPQVMFSI
jgi:hypothetical protein